MAGVGCLGLWEGVLAIVFRLVTHKPANWLTAANYLPAPWCYLAAVGAALLAYGVLAVLDSARKKQLD
jgi:hypothetical protein